MTITHFTKLIICDDDADNDDDSGWRRRRRSVNSGSGERRHEGSFTSDVKSFNTIGTMKTPNEDDVNVEGSKIRDYFISQIPPWPLAWPLGSLLVEYIFFGHLHVITLIGNCGINLVFGHHCNAMQWCYFSLVIIGGSG